MDHSSCWFFPAWYIQFPVPIRRSSAKSCGAIPLSEWGPPFPSPRLPRLLKNKTKQKRPNRTDAQREFNRGEGKVEAVQSRDCSSIADRAAAVDKTATAASVHHLGCGKEHKHTEHTIPPVPGDKKLPVKKKNSLFMIIARKCCYSELPSQTWGTGLCTHVCTKGGNRYLGGGGRHCHRVLRRVWANYGGTGSGVWGVRWWGRGVGVDTVAR